MKRSSVLFLLFALASIAGLTAQAKYHTVAVTVKEGETMAFIISDELSIQFNTEAMTITAPEVGETVSIPKGNIAEFVHSTAAIDDIATDISEPELTDGLLRFSNLPAGSLISIYNISGQQLKSITASGQFELPLSSLASGIYMITVNKSSFKIAVK